MNHNLELKTISCLISGFFKKRQYSLYNEISALYTLPFYRKEMNTFNNALK